MIIKITIEPRWGIDTHEGEIEIDDSEVEGMDRAERSAYIQEIAEDYVNNECPWGWTEATEDGRPAAEVQDA